MELKDYILLFRVSFVVVLQYSETLTRTGTHVSLLSQNNPYSGRPQGRGFGIIPLFHKAKAKRERESWEGSAYPGYGQERWLVTQE